MAIYARIARFGSFTAQRSNFSPRSLHERTYIAVLLISVLIIMPNGIMNSVSNLDTSDAWQGTRVER